MDKQMIKKVAFALASWGILASGVAPFLAGNYYQNALPFYLFFAAVVIIETFVPHELSRIGLELLCVPFLYYQYVPLDQPFGLNWLFSAIHFLKERFGAFLTTEFLLIREINILSIAVIMVIIAKLLLRYHHWIGPYLFYLFYLLSMKVTMNVEISRGLILLTGSAVLFVLMKNYESGQGQRWQLKGPVSFIGMIILAFGAAFVCVKQQTTLFQTALQETAVIRQKLKNTNFYQMIESFGYGGSVSLTGYSDNDSNLGGSLVEDNSLAFTASQKSPHYWRVSAKDYYTGTGWTRSFNAESQISNGEQFTDDLVFGSYQGEQTEQTITLHLPQKTTYLPLPIGSFSLDFGDMSVADIKFDQANTRMILPASFADEEREVKIVAQEPNYTEEELRGQNSFSEGMSSGLARYLVLPNNTPLRVRELSESITLSIEADYDKVKAIETYLRTNKNLRYSMKDAETLPKGEDFVDYFLFESQVGYCQHYASSMIVLVRAAGIPARWASGFNAGTRSANGVYRIYNKNAHAWPEVYFEGYGWIPFEPTPSFQNPDRALSAEEKEKKRQEENKDSSSSSSSSSSQSSSSDSKDSSSSKSSDAEKEATEKEANRSQRSSVRYLIPLGVIGIVLAGLAFVFRKKLALKYRKHMLRAGQQIHLTKAYLPLLRKLEQKYPRPASQALPSYAQTLPLKTKQDFEQLTAHYEAAAFGHETDHLLSKEERQWLLNVYQELYE